MESDTSPFCPLRVCVLAENNERRIGLAMLLTGGQYAPTSCPHEADVLVVEGDLLPILSTTYDSCPAILQLGDAPQCEIPHLERAHKDKRLSGWGYLPKEAQGQQILAAILAVGNGLTVQAGRQSETPSPLTEREHTVLQYLAQGLPNKIIASRLGVTTHTIKFHVAQILGKLSAASRTEAVATAVRQGYIRL
jgi:DNA-binding CsgD family transcriptional regulator